MRVALADLISKGPILLDGAWGTELQARGLPVGACPDLWNLEHPDRVQGVAQAYVDAGSVIILTNTFGANSILLERHDAAAQAPEINVAGAELSRAAAGEEVLVFGSMGPTGRMLMMGDVTEEALMDTFTQQAVALATGGADGLAVETMTDLEEARIAVRAAKATGLPVMASMVYDSGADMDHTMMGVDPETAAAGLIEAGADIIGSNCGQGIEGFIPICRRLRAVTDKPLWMKANAGLPEMVNGAAIYRTQPDEFAAWIPELLAAGANFVGGCCGTNPEFIRAVRKQL